MLARHPETKHFRVGLDNARNHHAGVRKDWIAEVQRERGVAEVLDHLDRYAQQQLASLMTERFHLSPRVEVVVVGLGRAS
jgi:hypothetical protein